MAYDRDRIGDREDLEAYPTGRLGRLSEMDDFEVADGEPDIRGWKVKTADGKEIGEVDDLIADTAEMKVRYLDIDLDDDVFDLKEDRHILVPIGRARLDDDDDEVILGFGSVNELRNIPPYTHGPITREYESSLRPHFGTTGLGRDVADDRFYGHEDYDENRFFGKRRVGRENAAYLTLSEEQLAVGKRRVPAGEVEVKKSIETKHVEKQVPTTREEVTVERRPATGRTTPEIGEDEIHVPLMAEEAVVEKRVVPQEEIVVKKHAVQDEKTVEADLRRERAKVEKEGDVRRVDRERDERL